MYLRCSFFKATRTFVTPAQAGVQWNLQTSTECHWIPACAGMTKGPRMCCSPLIFKIPLQDQINVRLVFTAEDRDDQVFPERLLISEQKGLTAAVVGQHL